MKIKMLASFAGEWSCNRGDEVERPDDEAIRLIDAGLAVPVRDVPLETAVAKSVKENTKASGTTETTTAPPAKPADDAPAADQAGAAGSTGDEAAAAEQKPAG